ncbi:Uncharacterised protein [Nocardia africana]|uniref:Uncharacterized protein n=1 Tax=Nocardia africana TaxID=134964 RepID=A0A378WWY2_9NOCA|nr:Uncharacterised protein [Nocardia africana]
MNRSGGMTELFDGVYAPSTVGTLLPESSFGHVKQLESVVREHLTAPAVRTDLLPGAAVRFSSISARCCGRSTAIRNRAPPTGTPRSPGNRFSARGFHRSRLPEHGSGRSPLSPECGYATGILADGPHGRARGATLRRKLANIPARPARPQRRSILHLPSHWPRSHEWLTLWHNIIGYAPPQPAPPDPSGPNGRQTSKWKSSARTRTARMLLRAVAEVLRPVRQTAGPRPNAVIPHLAGVKHTGTGSICRNLPHPGVACIARQRNRAYRNLPGARSGRQDSAPLRAPPAPRNGRELATFDPMLHNTVNPTGARHDDADRRYPCPDQHRSRRPRSPGTHP